jgi:dTDP-4-dehydrorhamnose reductase
MIKKVYIIGAGGMLGTDVYKIFQENNIDILAVDIDVNEPWITHGDIRNFSQMHKQIKKFQPDAIINLAALTDLEYCELNQLNCWQTNSFGAKNIGIISNQLNIPYIYISTAGIFDGKQEYYTDTDIPNPLSVYGKSKYDAEQFIIEHVKKSYVFRAGWMMGGFHKDKKFISKIYKQIQNGNTVLNVVDDKLGTPTYTKDFAKSIYLHLIQQTPYGLYNQVCSGSCSRFDVAIEFVKLLNVNVHVNKVSSNYFKNEYFAPRPKSEKLINKKLNNLNLNYMQDWKQCLTEYVDEIIETGM